MRKTWTRRIAVVGVLLAMTGSGLAQQGTAPTQAAPATPVPKGWENLQKFYDEHEVARDFFPFGFFGYGTGSSFATVQKCSRPPLYNSDQVTTLMHLESLVEHNLNAIWGAIPRAAKPVFSEGERFFYGEALPRYEIKTLPSVDGFRYNVPAMAKFQRPEPMLTDAEMAELEKVFSNNLSAARELVRQYPGNILGIVSDDEPDLFAPSVAAARLLEKYTGRLVTFTSPTFGRVQVFSQYMQPIVGDLYVCGDGARDSWSIASNLRWLAKERPGRLFWFMPLAGSWLSGQDPTLPDQPDSRTLGSELRLQCWSALALGAKGLFFFQQGEWCFSWGIGQDGAFDVLKRENDHHPRQHLAADLRDMGRDITSIGPSLLTAYPALAPAIPIAGGKVHYAAFKGPALDCGLLRDARAGRDFLVPWNNDVDRDQAGTLTVPAELLAGDRKVYDLHALKPVELGKGNTFRVALPPGSGHVYLLGDAKAFAEVRDSILRHRVWPDRVMARSLVERRAKWPKTLSFEKADALIEKAVAAEKKQDWVAAAQAYRAAVADMKAKDPLAGIDATLEKAGAFLSKGDDLLRTHGQNLYNLCGRQGGYRGYGIIRQQFGGVPIALEMDQWVGLGATYVSMKQQLYAGEVDWAKLDEVKAAAEKMVTDAETVIKSMQAKFDQTLRQVRKPYRVAYVTPDREACAAITTYAWAYRTLNVSWIAPDAKGVLRDEDGKKFVPSDYNVVWVRQTMYHQPPDDGSAPAPQQALLPALMDPATLEAMRTFVKSGGGVLLTGIAGLYALPLGVETVTPDRLSEDHSPAYAFNVGLITAPGAEGHPALAHLPAKGLLSNRAHPGELFVNECAWEKSRPTGTVLAQEFDDAYGRMDDRAAMVEYALGQGKVLVLGGAGGNIHKAGSPVVPVLLDAVGYLAGKERFAVKPVAATAKKQQISWLPVDGWRFALDKAKVGTDQGWFKPEYPDKDWAILNVKANWEVQGFPNYDGHAWYRFPVTAANRPGMRTLLHFSAVDEEAVVYLDGKLAGKHEKGWEGWDQPFAFDITGLLTDKAEPHLLAVRVNDTLMAGGIWKPVSLRYEPVSGETKP